MEAAVNTLKREASSERPRTLTKSTIESIPIQKIEELASHVLNMRVMGPELVQTLQGFQG